MKWLIEYLTTWLELFETFITLITFLKWRPMFVTSFRYYLLERRRRKWRTF